MKKPFDDILQECIRQLESEGGEIEAVLQRHPEEADRLRPYLQVWASLSAVEKSEATPQSVMRGRQQLLSRIAEAEQTKGGVRTMRDLSEAKTWGFRLLLPFVAGAAIALAAVFLAGGFDSGGGSTAQAGPIQDCILKLDFDGDGQLGVGDVEAFRTAIETQNPAFDLDGNTVVDIFDAVTAIKGVVQCILQLQPPLPTPPPLP